MEKKPTYEEFEQRVKELEKEAVERKRAEEALREKEEGMKSRLNVFVVFQLNPLFRHSNWGEASKFSLFLFVNI